MVCFYYRFHISIIHFICFIIFCHFKDNLNQMIQDTFDLWPLNIPNIVCSPAETQRVFELFLQFIYGQPYVDRYYPNNNNDLILLFLGWWHRLWFGTYTLGEPFIMKYSGQHILPVWLTIFLSIRWKFPIWYIGSIIQCWCVSVFLCAKNRHFRNEILVFIVSSVAILHTIYFSQFGCP